MAASLRFPVGHGIAAKCRRRMAEVLAAIGLAGTLAFCAAHIATGSPGSMDKDLELRR
jgi:hypothetical protein